MYHFRNHILKTCSQRFAVVVAIFFIMFCLTVPSEKKRAEYILKERAFANFLFGFYENTLFQYNESLKSRNKDRTDFLRKALDYFRNKVLRNPRLLYLWDSDGGKLSINYAESTIEDYDKNVWNNKDRSLALSIDSVGPYFIDTIKVSR